MRAVRVLVLIMLVLLVVTGVTGALVLADDYRNRIYPGVAIDDASGGLMTGALDVGGLTRIAARDRLSSRLASPDSQGITLEIGAQSWQLTWAMVGQSYEVDAAVAQALAVGRERPWWLGFTRVIVPRPVTIPISVVPADPALIRANVGAIAESIATAPQDADLVVAGGQVRGVPSQEGQWLDVDQATAQVIDALQQGIDRISLKPNAIAAEIPTAEPALSQAQALLSRPFVVVVDDPLT
ncbi:MAG: peptidoglycan binding domain-containing protein, partial [Anaerolineae bacterium]|nr:peptidoglycan binding domain-containing protein [Anaerolineae bacterium]